jgi:ribose transport system permease protein
MASSTTMAANRHPRLVLPRGLVTVMVALVLLVLAGLLFAPSSLHKGAVLGMLPFAAVLAVVALGQTLVVMQGGIDLSVAGSVSLSIVIVTHEAYGDNARVLPAAMVALVVAVLAGVLNGFLIGRLGLNAIVATLGTNALLYAGVLGVSGGTPRQTTDLLASIAGGTSVRGRRCEWRGRVGHRRAGPAVPRRRLRLGPGLLLARRDAPCRNHQQADGLPG